LKLLNVLNRLIRIWFWKCLELTYVCIMRDLSLREYNFGLILTIHLSLLPILFGTRVPLLRFEIDIWCRFLALIVFYHDVLELRQLLDVFLCMFPVLWTTLLLIPCKSTLIIRDLKLLGRSTIMTVEARNNLRLEPSVIDVHNISTLLF
jgi:hypothetical protein